MSNGWIVRSLRAFMLLRSANYRTGAVKTEIARPAPVVRISVHGFRQDHTSVGREWTKEMNTLEGWKSLLSPFSMNPPVDETTINTAETGLTIRFPSDYRDFLKFADGGEGQIGSGGYAALCRRSSENVEI
jgi:hypothetical protein